MSEITPLSSRHDFQFEVRFRLDDLRELFEPPGGKRRSTTRTVHIAQDIGWSLEFKSARKKADTTSDETDISAYFHNSSSLALPVTLSLRIETVGGKSLRDLSTTPTPDDTGLWIKWGWQKALSHSDYWTPGSGVCLQVDNAVLVTARVSSERPKLPDAKERVKDVLYRRLINSPVSTVRAFAFASRRPDGGLRRPREYQVDVDIVQESCKWMSHLLDGDAMAEKSEGLMEMKEGFSLRDLESLSADFVDDGSDYEDEETPAETPLSRKSTQRLSRIPPEERMQLPMFLDEGSDGDIDPGNEPDDTQDFKSEVAPSETALSESATSVDVDRMSEDWSVSDDRVASRLSFFSYTGEKVNNAKPEEPIRRQLQMQATIEERNAIRAESNEVARKTTGGGASLNYAEVDKLTETGSEAGIRIDQLLPERVILITGIAAKTWGALLFFMYTGSIEFAPLRSEGRSVYVSCLKEYCRRSTDRPAPCSCKSIYRIAKKIGLKDLQALALNHLKSRLTLENIIAEVYSKFTSEHQEIMDLELGILAEHWEDLRDTAALKEKVREVALGKCAHGGEVIIEILKRVGSLSP